MEIYQPVCPLACRIAFPSPYFIHFRDLCASIFNTAIFLEQTDLFYRTDFSTLLNENEPMLLHSSSRPINMVCFQTKTTIFGDGSTRFYFTIYMGNDRYFKNCPFETNMAGDSPPAHLEILKILDRFGILGVCARKSQSRVCAITQAEYKLAKVKNFRKLDFLWGSYL